MLVDFSENSVIHCYHDAIEPHLGYSITYLLILSTLLTICINYSMSTISYHNTGTCESHIPCLEDVSFCVYLVRIP